MDLDLLHQGRHREVLSAMPAPYLHRHPLLAGCQDAETTGGAEHDGVEIDRGAELEQNTRRDLFRNVNLQWITL